mgnify:FL=1|tara:strand:- start:891 stop:1565 length:675 start_codon:yes stop_codon:yes gene_type:complete
MNLTKNKKIQIEGIDFLKSYKLSDAVKIIKERKYVKFDESLDVSINTGIDSKQSDQNVRGSFIPPHGLGKKSLIAVFAQGKAAEEAKAAGAKHVGGEDLVSILEKKIDVDVIVATPDMMQVVSKIAKILGPKGLMPNPKTGTVTNDIKSTIENINKGLVAYKNDKAGTIHAALGKLSFEENKLTENVVSFLDEIKKIKPSGLKGNFLNSVYLSSSMGFGLKVEI